MSLFPRNHLLKKQWCLRVEPKGTEQYDTLVTEASLLLPSAMPKASLTSSNQRPQIGGINTANSQLDGTNLTQENSLACQLHSLLDYLL